MKNDALLKKMEERRFLKKAGFGKEHAGLGGLAVELYGPASSDPGQGRSTPRLAAPKLRGSGAAKRTLTDMCRECRMLRDEGRVFRDEALRALEAVGFARRMMRRDLVRLAWLAAGCTLVNVGVWFAVLLC